MSEVDLILYSFKDPAIFFNELNDNFKNYKKFIYFMIFFDPNKLLDLNISDFSKKVKDDFFLNLYVVLNRPSFFDSLDPKFQKSTFFQFVAILIYPYNLKHLTLEFLETFPFIVKWCLNQDSVLIFELPHKFKTFDNYLHITKSEYCSSKVFKTMPYKFKNKEICLKFVKANPKCLEYIPKKFIDFEMVKDITKHEFQFLPNNYKNNFIDFVKDDVSLYKYLPKELKTDELTELVLKRCMNLEILASIPKKYKTDENLINFLTQRQLYDFQFLENYMHIPRKFLLNENNVLKVVKYNYHILSIIPNSLRNIEFYEKAFLINNECMSYLDFIPRLNDNRLKDIEEYFSKMKTIKKDL